MGRARAIARCSILLTDHTDIQQAPITSLCSVFVLRCEPLRSVFTESFGVFFFCASTIADSAIIGSARNRSFLTRQIFL